MTGTPPISSTTQLNVNILLDRLRALRQQIEAARATIAPLEANLALAQKEFRAEIGYLLDEINRLNMEIIQMRSKIKGAEQAYSEKQQPVPATDIQIKNKKREEPKKRTTEEEAKYELVEHLVMILDDKDDELLALIDGLCSDPSIRLAYALEQLPWGIIWIKREPLEELTDQYQRLKTWEHALVLQLEELKRTVELIYRDSRYGLWLQYQKGVDIWKDFLAQVAWRYQEEKTEMEEELRGLQSLPPNMEEVE